jgi:hypothetical protein
MSLSGSVTSFTSAAGALRYESRIGPIMGFQIWRSQMATLVRILSRALPDNESELETLKTIAMLCGVGLLVSLMLATYGLDLSPGFF